MTMVSIRGLLGTSNRGVVFTIAREMTFDEKTSVFTHSCKKTGTKEREVFNEIMCLKNPVHESYVPFAHFQQQRHQRKKTDGNPFCTRQSSLTGKYEPCQSVGSS